MKRILERLDTNCFVTCSPAGTLHLTWRQFTLHMTQTDFLELARVLNLAVASPLPGHWIGGHPCAARHIGADSVALHLFGVGLSLPQEEFQAFHHLVQAALDKLNSQTKPIFWRLIDAEVPEQPEVVISLN
jgi:hypothetical protein